MLSSTKPGFLSSLKWTRNSKSGFRISVGKICNEEKKDSEEKYLSTVFVIFNHIDTEENFHLSDSSFVLNLSDFDYFFSETEVSRFIPADHRQIRAVKIRFDY